jgi:hypothetical protein
MENLSSEKYNQDFKEFCQSSGHSPELSYNRPVDSLGRSLGVEQRLWLEGIDGMRKVCHEDVPEDVWNKLNIEEQENLQHNLWYYSKTKDKNGSQRLAKKALNLKEESMKLWESVCDEHGLQLAYLTKEVDAGTPSDWVPLASECAASLMELLSRQREMIMQIVGPKMAALRSEMLKSGAPSKTQDLVATIGGPPSGTVERLEKTMREGRITVNTCQFTFEMHMLKECLNEMSPWIAVDMAKDGKIISSPIDNKCFETNSSKLPLLPGDDLLRHCDKLRQLDLQYFKALRQAGDIDLRSGLAGHGEEEEVAEESACLGRKLLHEMPQAAWIQSQQQEAQQKGEKLKYNAIGATLLKHQGEARIMLKDVWVQASKEEVRDWDDSQDWWYDEDNGTWRYKKD